MQRLPRGLIWHETLGRASQNSAVLMDGDRSGGRAGCWLRFTALFSGFALSGRKPPPGLFSPRVLIRELLTHCGSFRMPIHPPPSYLTPPPWLPQDPLSAPSANQKRFLLPIQVAQWSDASCAAGTTIFLLPRHEKRSKWERDFNTLRHDGGYLL